LANLINSPFSLLLLFHRSLYKKSQLGTTTIMQAGSLYLNYQYGFGNKVKLRGDHTNEVDKDNTLK